MGKLSNISVILFAIFFSVSSVLLAQSKSKSKSLPTKEKAVDHVKEKTGGRVLDVKQRSLESGANVWRVKILKEGHIQFIDVAPHTFSE